jgi:hypothetical protein
MTTKRRFDHTLSSHCSHCILSQDEPRIGGWENRNRKPVRENRKGNHGFDLQKYRLVMAGFHGFPIDFPNTTHWEGWILPELCPRSWVDHCSPFQNVQKLGFVKRSSRLSLSTWMWLQVDNLCYSMLVLQHKLV